jgi:hypothetical protein
MLPSAADAVCPPSVVAMMSVVVWCVCVTMWLHERIVRAFNMATNKLHWIHSLCCPAYATPSPSLTRIRQLATSALGRAACDAHPAPAHERRLHDHDRRGRDDREDSRGKVQANENHCACEHKDHDICRGDLAVRRRRIPHIDRDWHPPGRHLCVG